MMWPKSLGKGYGYVVAGFFSSLPAVVLRVRAIAASWKVQEPDSAKDSFLCFTQPAYWE